MKYPVAVGDRRSSTTDWNPQTEKDVKNAFNTVICR